MSVIREEGACYAYSKGDRGAFVLQRSEFARLKQEWMAGRAFFESVGIHGQTIVIKLGDIAGITNNSAEQLRRAREDDAEDDRADAIE